MSRSASSRRPLAGAAALLCLGLAIAPRAGAAEETAAAAWPCRVLPDTVEPGRPHAPVVTAVALRPAGDLLATAGDDQMIRLWRVADGALLYRLDGHIDWVRSVAFSPDGRVLASAGDDGRVILWDACDGEQLRVLARYPHAVTKIAFSHDGRFLAVAGFRARVSVLRAADGTTLYEAEAPCRDMRTIAFSPDDQIVAGAGGNGVIRLWFTADGRTARDLLAHRRRVRALAFSPNGAYLASAGDDRLVQIHALNGEESGFTLPPQPAKVLSLVFLGPDRVAAAGADNCIRIWSLASRRQTARLEGHVGSIAALAFLHDTLVSGSFDTTVRLWTVQANAQPADSPLTDRVGDARSSNPSTKK